MKKVPGRPPSDRGSAREREHVEPLYPTARIRGRQFAGLIALLIAPGLALRQLAHAVDAWVLVGALASVSALTYHLYSVDKRRAQTGAWRIPEGRLHLLELGGGWPGAFLAQRRLRHKTRKIRYQVVFWLIVIGYQFAAADYLAGWPISRSIRQTTIQLVARFRPAPG